MNTQAKSRTTGREGIFSGLKRGVLVLGVCASLAASSFGLAGHAYARMSQPGSDDDTFTWGCYLLQQQEDQLIAQYSAIASANPNDPRLDGLLAQIRNVGQNWQQIGCEDVFGPIEGDVGASTNGAVHVGTAGTLQGPDKPSGPNTRVGVSQTKLQ